MIIIRDILDIFGKYYNTETECRNINASVFDGYRAYLMGKKLSPKTVNTMLKAVQTFFNFCIRKGYFEHSFDMELNKVPRKIKEVYTREELTLLFQQPKKGCPFSEYRNWVLVQYLYGTGQRLRTVRNIKIKDLDLEYERVLLTVDKNRKQRYFPLGQELVTILKKYLKIRKGTEEDYLFCNMYGDKFSNTGIQTAVRTYNVSRGVMKTSAHLFRHAFARTVVEKGASANELMELLGHSDIKVSMMYLDIYGTDLNRNFSRLNPLSDFNIHKKAISTKPEKNDFE